MKLIHFGKLPTVLSVGKFLPSDQIKYAKRDYFKSYISTDLPTKELWKRLKQHGVLASDKSDIPFEANSINHYFSSSITIPPAQSSSTAIPVMLPYASSSFSFRNITIVETIQAIASVKSNSIGSDGLPLKFIKLIVLPIAPFLTHLFNHILTTSEFPKFWKSAKVIPIPKTNLVRSMKDLRPISILSGLSKAFERIVQNQINCHIASNKLLSPLQSGFRENRGTDTALLCITNDLITMMDNRQLALLTLLDFSKAFDLVNHELLTKKLYDQFGFSSSAVKLIVSYLSNRSQYVTANGVVSNSMNIYAGVPQGSILGPLLFSMFINDLPNSVKYCRCHMFADDVQLYIGGKSYDMRAVTSNLNEDLENIERWASANQLLLNPTKSKCVLFALHNFDYHRGNLNAIKMKGLELEISCSALNLGVTMDSGFTWNDHVNNVCGRIYGGLRCLWSSSSLMSQSTKIMLVKTLLMPHLNYCSPVMGLLHGSIFDKLQKCFYACLRFVYNVPQRTHMTEYAISFLGCNLKTFLNFRICVMIHKVIKRRQPDYLFNKLHFGNSDRICGLLLPNNHTRVMNDSFFVFGITLYNRIPFCIRSVASLSTFKRLLLEFLCANSF